MILWTKGGLATLGRWDKRTKADWNFTFEFRTLDDGTESAPAALISNSLGKCSAIQTASMAFNGIFFFGTCIKIDKNHISVIFSQSFSCHSCQKKTRDKKSTGNDNCTFNLWRVNMLWPFVFCNALLISNL